MTTREWIVIGSYLIFALVWIAVVAAAWLGGEQ